jgi:excisionase family DNA binding protein
MTMRVLSKGSLPNVPEDLLTPVEVASLLGKHRSTITRWIRQEKLPHTRIGARLYVSMADIQQYVIRTKCADCIKC